MVYAIIIFPSSRCSVGHLEAIINSVSDGIHTTKVERSLFLTALIRPNLSKRALSLPKGRGRERSLPRHLMDSQLTTAKKVHALSHPILHCNLSLFPKHQPMKTATNLTNKYHHNQISHPETFYDISGLILLNFATITLLNN